MTESQYNSVNDQRHADLREWLISVVPSITSLSPMTTDAGMRRYFRIHTAKSTLIAVDADPHHEDTRAFIDIAERISTTGLHTPAIYHYNLEKGFMVVEDLGDLHLQLWLLDDPSRCDAVYRTACNTLVTLQQRGNAVGLPSFDRDFILFELGIFEEWYLRKYLDYPVDNRISAIISNVNEQLVENCEQQPQRFMHRDFHSRNLMVTSPSTIAIIDFQGAMLGPITYDLGSLMKDAYVNIPDHVQMTLCDQHHRTLAPEVSREVYDRWYRLTALQRHLKIMGLFCRLHYRDGKPQYLAHLPTVTKHVRDTLQRYKEFDQFSELFDSFTSMSIDT